MTRKRFNSNILASSKNYAETKQFHITYLEQEHHKNREYLESIQMETKEVDPLIIFKLTLEIQFKEFKRNKHNTL